MAFQLRKALWKNFPAVLIILGVWSLLNLLFGFYWLPRDTQFWMPVLLGWWIMAGVTLFEALRAVPPNRRSWWAFILFVPALMVIVNGLNVPLLHRDLRGNLPYQLAAFIGQTTRPGDVIITAEDDRYIPYFTHRESLSLFRSLVSPDLTQEQVYADLDARIAEARAAGQDVYLVEFPDPSSALWRELIKAGLSPEDFSRFQVSPAWEFNDRTIYRVTGLTP